MAQTSRVSGDRERLADALRSEGLFVTLWQDEANARYEAHAHPGREVRVVLTGGMTVVADGRTYDLGPLDRIDLEPGETHSASVHPAGVSYLAGSGR